MKIEFYVNKESVDSVSGSARLREILDEEGIECYNYGELGGLPDAIACFGGDGTVLALSNYVSECGVPVLAVNTGTVGFLASVEPKELKDAVMSLKNGDYSISERSMIEVSVGCMTYRALNDVVVERDKRSEKGSVISKLGLKIGGVDVYDLRADGIIIATPTGSTAYSLSAGGVILTPELKSLIATPICSHSLTTRPIVYSDNEVAEITMRDGSSNCVLCVDGRNVGVLTGDASVKVRISDKRLKIIDFNKNFFQKIKTKLGE